MIFCVTLKDYTNNICFGLDFFFKLQEKQMHLKISSAEVIAANNCLTNLITDELSIEANSMDPEQTAPIGAV